MMGRKDDEKRGDGRRSEGRKDDGGRNWVNGLKRKGRFKRVLKRPLYLYGFSVNVGYRSR
jgi:hypothetical protein